MFLPAYLLHNRRMNIRTLDIHDAVEFLWNRGGKSRIGKLVNSIDTDYVGWLNFTSRDSYSNRLGYHILLRSVLPGNVRDAMGLSKK